MLFDIHHLHKFYQTKKGHIYQRAVANLLVSSEIFSPRGLVTFFGYAIPYFPLFEGGKILSLMPEDQGVLKDERFHYVLPALVQKEHIPLPAERLEHIIVLHTLEAMKDLDAVLEEFWRVLKPGGTLMLIFPGSFWGRYFGDAYEAMYTAYRLFNLLERHNFFIKKSHYATRAFWKMTNLYSPVTSVAWAICAQKYVYKAVRASTLHLAHSIS